MNDYKIIQLDDKTLYKKVCGSMSTYTQRYINLQLTDKEILDDYIELTFYPLLDDEKIYYLDKVTRAYTEVSDEMLTKIKTSFTKRIQNKRVVTGIEPTPEGVEVKEIKEVNNVINILDYIN